MAWKLPRARTGFTIEGYVSGGPTAGQAMERGVLSGKVDMYDD